MFNNLIELIVTMPDEKACRDYLISYKHLLRYCDEFAYRYNSRKIKDAERFTNSLQQIERRLTYKSLIGKE